VPTTDAAIVRTGREIPLLRRVERSRIAADAWRAGAWVAGGFGALSLLIASAVLALVHPGALPTAISVVFASIPLLVALPAAARANKLRREREQTLDQAWALVASDVVASRANRDVSAADLAAALGIDERRAERLLAHLSAENLVAAHVTQEGDVVYGASEAGRVRVEMLESATSIAGDAAEAAPLPDAAAPAAEASRER
jgi:hypothetical protein